MDRCTPDAECILNEIAGTMAATLHADLGGKRVKLRPNPCIEAAIDGNTKQCHRVRKGPSMGSKTKSYHGWAGASLGAALTIVAAGSAWAAGPFDRLSGSWSGGGTISMNDGHNERIRCKAVYEVVPSGIILHQNLKCASDSYKFEVRSSLQADGSSLTGTWSELSRQVTGRVTGTISGDQISTSVDGTGFSATLNLTTRGNSQVVSIAPSGTDIRSVQIDLKRS